MPPYCRPGNWTDTYDSLLPQIEKSFSECIERFNTSIDEELRTELINMIKQLCCPDPRNRGDKKNSSHLRYSMQRYISKLDLLASKYEYKIKNTIG